MIPELVFTISGIPIQEYSKREGQDWSIPHEEPNSCDEHAPPTVIDPEPPESCRGFHLVCYRFCKAPERCALMSSRTILP